MKTKEEIIPSVNYHLLRQCNMNCKFCFARFRSTKSTILPLDVQQKMIRQFADFGFEKITFVGGEPLLYSQLPDLIKYAKQCGLTTMVVTNGSLITKKWIADIAPFLDWIGLSIDSLDPNVNKATGRYVFKDSPFTKDKYLELCKLITSYNIRLKLNTVVHAENCSEDMGRFVEESKAERWKIMKVLHIKGENDDTYPALAITEAQFQTYLQRHDQRRLPMVAENNNSMKGSYVMVSPQGQFFSNSSGRIVYSDAIEEVGVVKAFSQMDYNYSKFIDRKGKYNWKNTKTSKTKNRQGCVLSAV